MQFQMGSFFGRQSGCFKYASGLIAICNTAAGDGILRCRRARALSRLGHIAVIMMKLMFSSEKFCGVLQILDF
jgi:hypothetical protein